MILKKQKEGTEMKKVYTTIIAALAVVVLAGACSSGSKDAEPAANKTDKVKIGEGITETREDENPYNEAYCEEQLATVTEGLDSIATGAEYLPYASEVDKNDFLATAGSFVNTSIDIVEDCVYLDPVAGQNLLNALEELGDTIELF